MIMYNPWFQLVASLYVAALLFKTFSTWNAVFYGSAVLALMAAAGALVLRNAPLPKKTMAAEPAVANAVR